MVHCLSPALRGIRVHAGWATGTCPPCGQLQRSNRSTGEDVACNCLLQPVKTESMQKLSTAQEEAQPRLVIKGQNHTIIRSYQFMRRL